MTLAVISRSRQTRAISMRALGPAGVILLTLVTGAACSGSSVTPWGLFGADCNQAALDEVISDLQALIDGCNARYEMPDDSDRAYGATAGAEQEFSALVPTTKVQRRPTTAWQPSS